MIKENGLDSKKVLNNVEDIYELTNIQKANLKDYLLEEKEGLFHESLVFEFEGIIEKEVFQECWKECILKYSVLRTAFYYQNLKQPVQIVLKDVKLPLEFIDWTDITINDGFNRLVKILEEDKKVRYEMNKAPLMRMQLFQCKSSKYLFSWRFHHIIMDGWAFAIVLMDLLELYRKRLGKEIKGTLPVGYPFKEYVQYRKFRDTSNEQKFWKDYLEGLKRQSTLTKILLTNPEKSNIKHGRLDYSLCEYYPKLEQVIKENTLNLNSAFQAIYALLISYFSDGSKDITTGQIVADRPLALKDSESRVGLFVNTVPIRCQIDENKKFTDWAKDLQVNILQVFQYAASSETEIKEWIGIDRENKLFENILVFKNIPIDNHPFANLPFQLIKTSLESHPNYSFQLFIWPDENLEFKFIYNTDSYDEKGILQFLNGFRKLLEIWLREPQTTVKQLMKKLEE